MLSRSPPTGSAGSTPTPPQPRWSPCTQQGPAVPGGVPALRVRPVRSYAGPLLLHANGQRVLDIGGPGTAGRSQRQRQALAEEAGEALRLLYVGLTRAQSQVVTWWAPTKNTQCSGLHRVLFGRRDLTGAVPDDVPLVADDLAAAGGCGNWSSAAAAWSRLQRWV